MEIYNVAKFGKVNTVCYLLISDLLNVSVLVQWVVFLC